MILHALTILINELNSHLSSAYGITGQAKLGNLAEGFGNNAGTSSLRDSLILSMINISEEKTLKNQPNHYCYPNHRCDETALKVIYQNQPVFLNLQILLTATHVDYSNALLMLSRGIQFFQYKNVFTQETAAASSIQNNAPQNLLDQLEVFKLILDLHSPTLEEVNYLWSTLGSKQCPFALYKLRMLDLQFINSTSQERPLVKKIKTVAKHKPPEND